MRFQGKNENGELVELPVRVRTDEDHQNIYAHGATGGFLANYHFRLDFYRDEFPPVDDVMIRGGEVIPGSLTAITRTVLSTVFLSASFAKELRNWLDKNIAAFEAEYGDIALPKGDESEDQTVSKIKKEA